MADLHLTLGSVIRDHRRQKGFSHEELAARSGIHRTYVSAVELGKVRLGLAAAKRLADGLGVPLATLISEAETQLSEGEVES